MAATAADINRHHDLARASAITAMNHAMEAGKLLRQVKGSMSHGEWLPWLAANVTVSLRQAQRYIAVAEGKPAPIRALASTGSASRKNGRSNAPSIGPAADTTPVSHLTPEAGAMSRALSKDRRTTLQGPPGWEIMPTWTPEPGRWYWSAPQESGSFVVEPSSAHPGFWFVSRIVPGGDQYDCTARPVRADWVDETLIMYGLKAMPGEVEWLTGASAGVRIAMETLSAPETVEALLSHKETVPEAIARMERTSAAGRAAIEGRP